MISLTPPTCQTTTTATTANFYSTSPNHDKYSALNSHFTTSNDSSPASMCSKIPILAPLTFGSFTSNQTSKSNSKKQNRLISTLAGIIDAMTTQ